MTTETISILPHAAPDRSRFVAIFRSVQPVALIFYLLAIPAVFLLSDQDSVVKIRWHDFIVPALVLPICYYLGLALCVRWFSFPQATRAYSLSFLVRAVVAFSSACFFQHADEPTLHFSAIERINRGLPWWQGNGYEVILATIYRIFGENFLMPKVLAVTVFSFLPLILYRFAEGLFRNKSAATFALNAGIFLPPLVLYSAYSLKEMPCIFTTICALYVLMFTDRSILIRFFVAIAVVAFVAFLRGAWAIIPGSIATFYLFLHAPGLLGRVTKRRFVFFAITLVVTVVALAVSPVYDRVMGHLQSRIYVGSHASWGSFRIGSSGSITRSLLDSSDPWSIKNIIIQVLRAPFSPSPLSYVFRPSVVQFLDALVSLTQYVLYPYAIIGALTYLRRRSVLIISAMQVIVTVVAGLSLLLGLNISRHGMVQFPMLTLLAAGGLRFRGRYKPLIFVWWFAVFIVNYFYVAFNLRQP